MKKPQSPRAACVGGRRHPARWLRMPRYSTRETVDCDGGGSNSASAKPQNCRDRLLNFLMRHNLDKVDASIRHRQHPWIGFGVLAVRILPFCQLRNTTILSGALTLVAQHEARMVSERTKASLAAYKRRGGLLGGSRQECRNLTEKARAKGRRAASAVISQQAREAYADLLPAMLEWREAGLSQQAIADRLNADGQTTRRGKPWSQVQVMRVLTRY